VSQRHFRNQVISAPYLWQLTSSTIQH
jgi:hypothetical protein